MLPAHAPRVLSGPHDALSSSCLDAASMGREPEPNLGIDEIAVCLAKLSHGYAREQVLEVDNEKIPQRDVGSERLAAPLFTLHAVAQRFGVPCTRQGGPRANNDHNVADGSPPPALALVAPRLTPSAPSRERWAVSPCVCVDVPLCAAVSQGM